MHLLPTPHLIPPISYGKISDFTAEIHMAPRA